MLDPILSSKGIHSATFRDLEDQTYWGQAQVLGSAEADLTAEMVMLQGGSSQVPFQAAPGRSAGTLTLTVRQYDKQILRFLAPFLDTSLVELPSGETGGSVTSIINAKGTSLVESVTGIASIAVGTAENLAFGNYKLVATGAATVDIYIDNNLSGKVIYQDSNLKINDAPITIPDSGATVEFQGIEFTGGSGSVAFTTGDIATFSVNPISNYLLDNYFLKTGACAREFELTIYGECINNKYRRVHFPRCVASANTTPVFLEQEFAAMEATIQILKPQSVDYVARSTFVGR